MAESVKRANRLRDLGDRPMNCTVWMLLRFQFKQTANSWRILRQLESWTLTGFGDREAILIKEQDVTAKSSQTNVRWKKKHIMKEQRSVWDRTQNEGRCSAWTLRSKSIKQVGPEVRVLVPLVRRAKWPDRAPGAASGPRMLWNALFLDLHGRFTGIQLIMN